TEETADYGAGDHSSAVARPEPSVSLGPLCGWGDVGDHGGGHGICCPGDARDSPCYVEDPEGRSQGQNEIVDSRAGQGSQQYSTAAEAIGQSAQYRSAKELHYRVERGKQSDMHGDSACGRADLTQ